MMTNAMISGRLLKGSHDSSLSLVGVECNLRTIYCLSARHSLSDEVKLPKYAPEVPPPVNEDRHAKQQKYRSNKS